MTPECLSLSAKECHPKKILFVAEWLRCSFDCRRGVLLVSLSC